MQTHDAFLTHVLAHARKTIVIVSPWITKAAMQQFSEAMRKSLAKGIKVHVITEFQKCMEQKNNGLPALEESCVIVHKVNRPLHAKLLFCDKHIVVSGLLTGFLPAERHPTAK